MKKAEVKFSIELLNENRKHHKENLSKSNIPDWQKKHLSKDSIKYFEKKYKDHQRYYDDLTKAINILSGKKPTLKTKKK